MKGFEHARHRLYTLLRWSERYTKTDMVYLASGGLWLTLGQIGTGLCALLLSIIFARYIPKEAYGTYRYLISLFWTFAAFSFAGLSTAVTRAIAQGKEGAYVQSFRLTFLGSIPMSILAAGCSVYYFLNHNQILGWGIALIAVLGPIFQLGYLYGSFLEGKKEFRRNSIFGIILSTVPAIALIISILFTHNPLVLFFIYLAVNALTGLALCAAAFKIYKPNKTKSDDLVHLGWHFSAMRILTTVAGQADQLLIFHYLGTEPLALYSFATAMPDQIRTMFNSVASLAMPKFVQRDLAQVKKTFSYRIIAFTAVIAVSAVVYIFLAPLVFHILFPAYTDGVFYSQLYAIALIPIASMIPDKIFTAHAAKKELYITSIVSPIFQIGVLFVLVISHGLLGIVIARIIGRTFNLLFDLVLIKKFFNKKIA